MTYTDQDLERAWDALRNTPGCTVGLAVRAARLMDDVRRETRNATVEECARLCAPMISEHLAGREGRAMAKAIHDSIRALMDAPKAESDCDPPELPCRQCPRCANWAEPRCRVCGCPALDQARLHDQYNPSCDAHPFEPAPRQSRAPEVARQPQRCQDPSFLSVKMFASLTNTRPAWVRAGIARGFISAVRAGPRLWRIPSSEVDRLKTACPPAAQREPGHE